MFEIIKNKLLWDQYLNKIDHDVYHTYDYHVINSNSKETPILIKYNNSKTMILFPLIIRKIDGSNYFDATSSYGYVGPLCSNSEISNDELFDFQSKLLGFFKKSNIVSVFSRLHPIINNFNTLSDLGRVEELNKTVIINLELELDEQRRQYRKSNRSEINQLRRKGYKVYAAKSNKDIATFIEIYHKNMDRLKASEEYYFSETYFQMLLKSKSFKTEILLAEKEGVITSGAIFIISNKIMHYHLSGTVKDYLKDHPMKLIIDEARLLGNKLELKFLHLGGGNENLFLFKSGFSELRLDFKVWKLIVNQKIYDKLCYESNNKNSDFFPLYRS